MYRHDIARVSGLFRPNADAPLTQWTYVTKYDNRPVLGDDFIKETKDNLDRTLAVQSSTADQFIGDFLIT